MYFTFESAVSTSQIVFSKIYFSNGCDESLMN